MPDRARAFLELTPDAVLWLDRDGRIEARNTAAEALAVDASVIPAEVFATATEVGSWSGDLDGADLSAVVVADDDGFIVLLRDVAALRDAARRDSLTGLSNRPVLMSHLEQAVAAGARGHTAALLYVDVDRLKKLNDSRGHAAGDQYLVKLAAELTAVVRAEDVVARLGGDEFAVLMRNVAPADAERLGELVRTRLSATVSVGVALVDGKNSATDVLAVADAACYAAKAQGGNRTEFFTSP